MPEMDDLIDKIQQLRDQMHALIEEKRDLLDPEIMAVSRMLDLQLSEYEKLLKKESN